MRAPSFGAEGAPPRPHPLIKSRWSSICRTSEAGDLGALLCSDIRSSHARLEAANPEKGRGKSVGQGARKALARAPSGPRRAGSPKPNAGASARSQVPTWRQRTCFARCQPCTYYNRYVGTRVRWYCFGIQIVLFRNTSLCPIRSYIRGLTVNSFMIESSIKSIIESIIVG